MAKQRTNHSPWPTSAMWRSRKSCWPWEARGSEFVATARDDAIDDRMLQQLHQPQLASCWKASCPHVRWVWASRFQLQGQPRPWPITHQSCCTKRHQALPTFGFASPRTWGWKEWKAEFGSVNLSGALKMNRDGSELTTGSTTKIGTTPHISELNWGSHFELSLQVHRHKLQEFRRRPFESSSFIAKEISFDFFDAFEPNLLLVLWGWKIIGLKATCTFLALQNI